MSTEQELEEARLFAENNGLSVRMSGRSKGRMVISGPNFEASYMHMTNKKIMKFACGGHPIKNLDALNAVRYCIENGHNHQGFKAQNRRKKKGNKNGAPNCFLPSEFRQIDQGMKADREAAQYRITGKRNGGASKHRKSDPSFYSSMKWKQLRYLALKNTDGRCQCCGATAADGVQIHVDHIKPRSKYPDLALSLDNLAVLCSDCNIGKGSWDETDWREHWKSI